MIRIVETCTRGRQNSSFTKAQDVLNILDGSTLQDEQSEEPSCTTQGIVQEKGWTVMNGTSDT